MGVIIPQVVTEDRAGGALVIDGSLKFDKSKTQYLRRTISTPTSANTWTFSCWIKRNSISYSEYQYIFSYDSTASRGLAITATIDGNPDCFYIYDGANINVGTARKVRDASAWYHLVLRCSSGTATLYLNGESSPYITAAATMPNMSNGQTMGIGLLVNTSILPLDAQLSNLYFIDGQALDPSYFGYTDPLTNTWRPKKLSSSIAFGTNGFYLPFDGNSPIGQDMSGRGNNWTPVNFGGSNTLEKATGALPILNTDGGGKVARVGVRTDSNASSLVLALPLVGIKSDFSNAINSGTSNKTVNNISNNTTFSSSFSNFYGGSASFNGSNTVLNAGSSTDFQLATNFTVEFWVYLNSTSNSSLVSYYYYTDGDQERGWIIGISSNKIRFRNSFGGVEIITSNTVSTSRWYHIAAVINGGISQIYINGVADGASGNIGTPDYSNANLTIGAAIYANQPSGYSSYLNGYIQDLRVYKGTAKYTQNFIPASTDPDILPDTPSGVAYSSNVALVPTNEGAVSLSSNGSGDYLSLSASSDFGFSTPSGNSNDFTIEWFKYWTSLSGYQTIWSNNYISSPGLLIQTGNGDGKYRVFVSSGTEIFQETNAATTGKWYHYALVRNGTTYTLYRDGIANGSATSSSAAGSGSDAATIGQGNGSYYENGFISNFHVVKGTALYTSNFTPPTAPISSVANTKLLCCKSRTSATVFDVSPGTITANGDAGATNINPFTVNINTQRGQESGYCTWNPLDTAGSTLSNGNLNISTPSSGLGATRGTIGFSSGKWYYEHTIISGATAIGIMKLTDILVSGSGIIGASAGGYSYYSEGVAGGGYTKKINNGTQTDYGASFDPGDTISVAFDLDAGTITFYKNGISQGVAFSGLSGTFAPAISDGTNAGSIVGATNFGQKPFKFPPPAGFQPLALANTPRPTIVRPDQYVGIVTWTGSVATASATPGVNEPPVRTGWNFKPDFLWIKDRNQAWSIGHRLYDSVRGLGVNKHLNTEETSAEGSGNDETYGYVTGFVNGGFTSANGTSGNDYVNSSVTNYVGWAWKAGGSGGGLSFWKDDVGYSTASAAGLTAGTITPTGASVNTKSGFSIITYTGTNANATISHGLGNVPAFIIAKSRDTSSWNWIVYHKDIGVSDYLALESTQGSDTRFANIWGTGHTTSVFGVRTGYSNNPNGEQMVAYCWAEIPGFSKFGSYTGNGSTDGPVVITGFRPRWLLVKKLSATGNVRGWVIVDSERSKYNVSNLTLFPHAAATEDAGTYIAVDFLSNGFKLRSTEEAANQSYTYIYAAFAETPSFNLYGGQANAR